MTEHALTIRYVNDSFLAAHQRAGELERSLVIIRGGVIAVRGMIDGVEVPESLFPIGCETIDNTDGGSASA